MSKPNFNECFPPFQFAVSVNWIAVLQGIGARIIGRGCRDSLAGDVDAEEADAGDSQRAVRIVELLVVEPAEPRFVHHVRRDDGGPGGAPVFGSDRRITLLPTPLALLKTAWLCRPLGGDPSKQVNAEAERISIRGAPVEFAEPELLIYRPRNRLKLPVQKLPGPLCTARGVAGAPQAPMNCPVVLNSGLPGDVMEAISGKSRSMPS